MLLCEFRINKDLSSIINALNGYLLVLCHFEWIVTCFTYQGSYSCQMLKFKEFYCVQELQLLFAFEMQNEVCIVSTAEVHRNMQNTSRVLTDVEVTHKFTVYVEGLF